MTEGLQATGGTRLADDFALIFEESRPGRRAWSLTDVKVPAPPLEELIPNNLLRASPTA